MNKTCLVLSVTILTLSVAFSLVLTASAVWTAPTVDFPDGSPVAPLDQSNVDQTKSAALNLGALNLYSSIDITPIGLGVGQRIGSFLNGTYTGINFELSDLLGSKTTLSNTSGIFDINTNGVILPRPASAPTSPVEGTIYYRSSDKSVQFYTGSAKGWQAIGGVGGGASQWTDVLGFGIEYTGGRVRIKPTSGDPELQLQYGTGTNDHWGIFVEKQDKSLNVWSPSASATGGGNIVTISPYNVDVDTSIKKPARFSVNGQICLNGTANSNCLSSWPTGGSSLSGGTANYIPLWSSASALTISTIYQSATGDTKGNVGIGTADPSSKLSLAATGDPNLNTGSEREYASGGLTFMSSGGWVVGKINAVQPKDYYADAGDLAFSTAYGSVSEKMRIKSNTGNVGIGTASPGSQLHLYKNDNINNAEIALQSGNGTTVKDKWSIYNNGIGTGDGSLRFWNTNVPGDKNALTILNNGNVGIGTASPQGILDVRGKSDINLKLGSRSGSVNIGASGGLVPLNIYGDMNIFSVPLNSPTGYYYSLVDNIISLPDPKYNDPASATFNWWKAAFPSNFSTYPDGNDGWDVVKITNSRTDSQCEDTSLVATQCSENTYRAISSAPDFVYDFSRYKEEKEGGLTNFSISYRKFKKAVSGYGGGNLNAVKGSLSGDLNVEGSVTIGNHIKISGGVEFSDGTIQTTASSRKMFTANGEFTVPKGVTKVFVTMMSGGGGGGGGGLPNGDFGAGGGGGGSGDGFFNKEVDVISGSNIDVKVGVGGTGGTNYLNVDIGIGTPRSDIPSKPGGDSSFSTLLVTGGGGGGSGNAGSGAGGSGGIAGTGGSKLGTNGDKGGKSYTNSSIAGDGGRGGSVGIAGTGGTGGIGGTAYISGASGTNASGYGAGGGGGGGFGTGLLGLTGSIVGGNGSQGFVLVEW